jgi:hypothetical protein
MSSKIPAGATLTVIQPTYVEFYVTLNVSARPSYRNTEIARNIRSAFINPGGLFSYEAVDFGQTVSFSALIAKAQGVDGVISVNVTKFNTDNSSTVETAGVVLSTGSIPILQTANLIINVTGGLS